MRMRCEVLITVLAAACGGSSPTSAGGGGGGNPAASVTMTDYRFSPETVRVAVGSAVGWNNNGTTGHTSTSDTTGIWNSNAINPPGPPPQTCPYPPCDGTPGGSFQYTFRTAGTYPYHCAFHSALGMKGVVVVTP